jgi:hypothetical protein
LKGGYEQKQVFTELMRQLICFASCRMVWGLPWCSGLAKLFFREYSSLKIHALLFLFVYFVSLRYFLCICLFSSASIWRNICV